MIALKHLKNWHFHTFSRWIPFSTFAHWSCQLSCKIVTTTGWQLTTTKTPTNARSKCFRVKQLALDAIVRHLSVLFTKFLFGHDLKMVHRRTLFSSKTLRGAITRRMPGFVWKVNCLTKGPVNYHTKFLAAVNVVFLNDHMDLSAG